MDSNELRAACEMAGLVFDPFMHAWHTGDALLNNHWTIEARHPALPAHVAELLVAKVRERGAASMWLYVFELKRLHTSLEPDMFFPGVEAIIRAAMAVLGGGDNE